MSVIHPMFTLNVRGLTDQIKSLASLAHDRGNDHFTIDINLTKWLQLTREQQVQVLMHEMGHIACCINPTGGSNDCNDAA